MGEWTAMLRRSAGLAEQRSQVSIGDPALAEYLGIGARSSAGQSVTEASALGLTAFYRCVSLIAGTLGALPWKSYRVLPDDSRERVKSWLDDPGAVVGLTPFAWRELLYVHLAMWGNWFGLHHYNAAGALVGMQPLRPSAVSIEVDREDGTKSFKVTLLNGQVAHLSALDLTHIPAMSTDGVRGLSPLSIARNAIGAGLAADEHAARQYENGAVIAGLVTTEEDVTEAEATTISASLNEKLTGARNAGRIAMVNRALKFSPWTMTAEDAQFIESRAFQVEEIARFYGVPKVLLAEDGASTWGSGIAELVRGLEKFTFRPWAARVEAALSATLGATRFMEMDFAGLLAPSEAEVTTNMLAEIAAGTLTVDEARRLRNRPPLQTALAPVEAV